MSKGNATSYTEAEDRFIFTHAGRKSFTEIGETLHRTRNQIRGRYLVVIERFLSWLHDLHQEPTGMAKISTTMQQSVVQLFNRGQSIKDIAAATGLHQGQVGEIVQSNPGVDLEQRLGHIKDVSLIESLQSQLKEMTHQNNRLNQIGARVDAFLDEIRGEIDSLPLPNRIILPQVNYAPSAKPLIQVGLASDQHAEETVDREAMEGFNEFNFTIFKERIWYWVDRLIRLGVLRRHEGPIRELHVDFLGDTLSGEIHEELKWTNAFHTPRSIVEIARVLGQAIMILSAHYDKVVVNCVVGNHGRNSKKMHFKEAVQNSFDYSIYRIMEIWCRQAIDAGRVCFSIAPSLRMVIKRFDWNFLLHHGMGIKMHYGTPYYGMDRDKQKERNKRRKTDKDFDFVELGHFHQWCINDDTIMNGSVIGPGEFSTNALSDNKPPVQVCLFVDEKRGLRSVEPIFLKFADGQGHKFQ